MKDFVTGLMSTEDFLKEASRVMQEETKDILVIYSDLTNFRYFNEAFGLDAGNELLRKLAEERFIDDEMCKAATRIYADKCAAVFAVDMDRERLHHYLGHEIDKIESHIDATCGELALKCNLGIHTVEPGETFREALDKAEIAWKEAKKSYSKRFVEYSRGMEAAKDKESKVLSLFRKALLEDRFVVHLQPKVDAMTGKLVGAEALVRMMDKDGKLIMPGEFIPILENAGPVVEVDRFVAGKVFRQIREWMSRGITPVPISINMSGKHFYNNDFVNYMQNDIDDWNIPAKYIELEVTESVFLGDAEDIAENINNLRELGVKISMDDFGSGFASMNMMCVLPIDVVKLDRSFVLNAKRNKKGVEILRRIVDLLRSLDFDIICEGVETKAELDLVQDCGCRVIQGYYYAKPMPVEDFEQKFLCRA